MKQFPRYPSSTWADAVARGETSPFGGWPTCPRCGHPAVLDAFGRCTDCAGEAEGKPSRELPPPPLPRPVPSPKAAQTETHNLTDAELAAYVEEHRTKIEAIAGPAGVVLVVYSFVATQQEIAERLETDQSQVTRWLSRLNKGGIRTGKFRRGQWLKAQHSTSASTKS